VLLAWAVVLCACACACACAFALASSSSPGSSSSSRSRSSFSGCSNGSSLACPLPLASPSRRLLARRRQQYGSSMQRPWPSNHSRPGDCARTAAKSARPPCSRLRLVMIFRQPTYSHIHVHVHTGTRTAHKHTSCPPARTHSTRASSPAVCCPALPCPALPCPALPLLSSLPRPSTAGWSCCTNDQQWRPLRLIEPAVQRTTCSGALTLHVRAVSLP